MHVSGRFEETSGTLINNLIEDGMCSVRRRMITADNQPKGERIEQSSSAG
jgi:hypothetical protein